MMFKTKGVRCEMTTVFYGVVFVLSLICSAVYVHFWHKHFDANFNMIFTIVPLSCLGYLLFALAKNAENAVIAVQISYIGGCFLQFFILESIITLCNISVKRWMRTVLFSMSAFVYVSTLTIGYLPVFYKEVSFEKNGNTVILNREYAFMHTVFYVLVFLLFFLGIVAIIYALLKKNQVPKRILQILLIPDVVCMVSFFAGKLIRDKVDLVPLGYLIAQIMFLGITFRINLYDVAETVIDSMVRERGIGYVSFDFMYRYLGSNDIASTLMPELAGLAVDEQLGYKPSLRKLRRYIDDFKRDSKKQKHVFTLHDPDGDPEKARYFNVDINYLYDGSRKCGYVVTFTDDTSNRRYIRLLDSYNEKLQREVALKTSHITEMHDNLIMSLAMMVESRDNSTGGHIKRTSEGVRILVGEIVKEGKLDLSKEFCQNVIKAAPMHDLGKIAVDDAVLRKPGRFTPEEYDMMKKHTTEGARVIHEILLNTDDEMFKSIAENVAHFHHERWDGSGYPKGLAGENIPIEARIMAIADVYDALVSKRVYKEAFDASRADSIIMEGMGTQFDPGLKSAYEKARPRLEAYYRDQEEA